MREEEEGAEGVAESEEEARGAEPGEGRGAEPEAGAPDRAEDATGAAAEPPQGGEGAEAAVGEGADGKGGEEGGEAAPDADAAVEGEPVDPALAAALDEAAKWKDRAARLQADFDNYRKRQAREREEVLRQANADLLEELLPVLDQTDTAIAAAAKDASDAARPFLDGFELLRRTFLNAVAKFGLKPVELEIGKPLDPEKAEAISVAKTGTAPAGTVALEARKGYTLGGRLLRAAQVVVESEE